MNQQDKKRIQSFAKDLTELNLGLEYATEALKTVFLMGKAAESKERLDEFKKSKNKITGE